MSGICEQCGELYCFGDCGTADVGDDVFPRPPGELDWDPTDSASDQVLVNQSLPDVPDVGAFESDIDYYPPPPPDYVSSPFEGSAADNSPLLGERSPSRPRSTLHTPGTPAAAALVGPQPRSAYPASIHLKYRISEGCEGPVENWPQTEFYGNILAELGRVRDGRAVFATTGSGEAVLPSQIMTDKSQSSVLYTASLDVGSDDRADLLFLNCKDGSIRFYCFVPIDWTSIFSVYVEAVYDVPHMAPAKARNGVLVSKLVSKTRRRFRRISFGTPVKMKPRGGQHGYCTRKPSVTMFNVGPGGLRVVQVTCRLGNLSIEGQNRTFRLKVSLWDNIAQNGRKCTGTVLAIAGDGPGLLCRKKAMNMKKFERHHCLRSRKFYVAPLVSFAPSARDGAFSGSPGAVSGFSVEGDSASDAMVEGALAQSPSGDGNKIPTARFSQPSSSLVCPEGFTPKSVLDFDASIFRLRQVSRGVPSRLYPIDDGSACASEAEPILIDFLHPSFQRCVDTVRPWMDDMKDIIDRTFFLCKPIPRKSVSSSSYAAQLKYRQKRHHQVVQKDPRNDDSAVANSLRSQQFWDLVVKVIQEVKRLFEPLPDSPDALLPDLNELSYGTAMNAVWWKVRGTFAPECLMGSNPTGVFLSQYVHAGRCRERSLFFKALCDYFKIPCRLVRGVFNAQVMEDGQPVVVDGREKTVKVPHAWPVLVFADRFELAEMMVPTGSFGKRPLYHREGGGPGCASVGCPSAYLDTNTGTYTLTGEDAVASNRKGDDMIREIERRIQLRERHQVVSQNGRWLLRFPHSSLSSEFELWGYYRRQFVLRLLTHPHVVFSRCMFRCQRSEEIVLGDCSMRLVPFPGVGDAHLIKALNKILEHLGSVRRLQSRFIAHFDRVLRKILQDVFSGLAYIHSRRVTHNALKYSPSLLVGWKLPDEDDGIVLERPETWPLVADVQIGGFRDADCWDLHGDRNSISAKLLEGHDEQKERQADIADVVSVILGNEGRFTQLMSKKLATFLLGINVGDTAKSIRTQLMLLGSEDDDLPSRDTLQSPWALSERILVERVDSETSDGRVITLRMRCTSGTVSDEDVDAAIASLPLDEDDVEVVVEIDEVRSHDDS